MTVVRLCVTCLDAAVVAGTVKCASCSVVGHRGAPTHDRAARELEHVAAAILGRTNQLQE